jgi:hypothetical protein
VRAFQVGRFDLTPLAALASVFVGWLAVDLVLGIF